MSLDSHVFKIYKYGILLVVMDLLDNFGIMSLE